MRYCSLTETTNHTGSQKPPALYLRCLCGVSAPRTFAMEITATFFSSVRLQRKASIKSDTDLRFGAFGVRTSYKGAHTKSVKSVEKPTFHPYKNYVLFQCKTDWWKSDTAPPFYQKATLSRKGPCSITASLWEAGTTDFLNHFETLAAASWRVLGLYRDVASSGIVASLVIALRVEKKQLARELKLDRHNIMYLFGFFSPRAFLYLIRFGLHAGVGFFSKLSHPHPTFSFSQIKQNRWIETMEMTSSIYF